MKKMSHYVEDIHFDKIFLLLTFAVCLLLSQNTSIGLCMPGGNDGVNLGLIEIYRPLVNQLPVESSCRYLFSHFEELGEIIRTSRLGRLPGSDEAYELITQLYPEQLQSLIDSLAEGSLRIWPQSIQQRYTLFSTELLRENMECLTTLNEITRSMSAVYSLTNHPLDLINCPLEERFSYLIRNLNFSPEAESSYATQILVKTSRLYSQYDRLLALLLALAL